MNTSSLASLVTVKSLRTIKVKFPDSSKIYTYKTVDDSIKEDEFVVVSFNDAIVKIARVTQVDKVPDLSKDLQYKWIVQKVDFTKYNMLNELESETFDNLRILETQALVDNAEQMLADKLNINVETLHNTITKQE